MFEISGKNYIIKDKEDDDCLYLIQNFIYEDSEQYKCCVCDSHGTELCGVTIDDGIGEIIMRDIEKGLITKGCISVLKAVKGLMEEDGF